MVQETERQLSPRTGTNIIKDIVHAGLKCQSEDSFYVVQFNKDSFVFSRLKPYEDWEKFSQEALRLWEIYCELPEPTEIGRIGLRFINRLATKQSYSQILVNARYNSADFCLAKGRKQ